MSQAVQAQVGLQFVAILDNARQDVEQFRREMAANPIRVNIVGGGAPGAVPTTTTAAGGPTTFRTAAAGVAGQPFTPGVGALGAPFVAPSSAPRAPTGAQGIDGLLAYVAATSKRKSDVEAAYLEAIPRFVRENDLSATEAAALYSPKARREAWTVFQRQSRQAESAAEAAAVAATTVTSDVEPSRRTTSRGFLLPGHRGRFARAIPAIVGGVGALEAMSAVSALKDSELTYNMATDDPSRMAARVEGATRAWSGPLGTIAGLAADVFADAGPRQLARQARVELARLDAQQGLVAAQQDRTAARRIRAADTGVLGSDFDVANAELLNRQDVVARTRAEATRIETEANKKTAQKIETRRLVRRGLVVRAENVVSWVDVEDPHRATKLDEVKTRRERATNEEEQIAQDRRVLERERLRFDRQEFERQRTFTVEAGEALAQLPGLTYGQQRQALRAVTLTYNAAMFDAEASRLGSAASLQGLLATQPLLAAKGILAAQPLLAAQGAQLTAFDAVTRHNQFTQFNAEQRQQAETRQAIDSQRGVNAAILSRQPLEAERRAIRGKRDRDIAALGGLTVGLVGGAPIFNPLAVSVYAEAEERERIAEQSSADARALVGIGQRTRREQLQAGLARKSALTVEAIGIRGAGQAEAERFQQQGLPHEAFNALVNSGLQLKLLGQNFLDQFELQEVNLNRIQPFNREGESAQEIIKAIEAQTKQTVSTIEKLVSD